MNIVIATHNKHKVDEIRAIFNNFDGDFNLLTPDMAGFKGEVDENGITFEENSLIKAKTISEYCNMPAIADDSGLMVDALDGAPGVYSSRFGGKDGDDDANNKKLTALLYGIEPKKRTAKFVSVITFYTPKGRIISARGECEGVILDSPMGSGGFGYDPLFFYQPLEKTFAQLTADEKNKVSHRAKALELFSIKLSEFLAE